MTQAQVTLSPDLKATDRCDRCGAQAYVRSVLPSGGELFFCAHHGRQLADSLKATGADIHDESSRLHDESHN